MVLITCVLFPGLVGITGCTASWSRRKEQPVPTGRKVQDAISLYEMGRQLEQHGNYVSAIDKYTESIEVSPRPIAYYALGSLQGELREFESAKGNLRKAIELAPGFTDARRELERIEAVEQLIERGEPIPGTLRDKPVPPSLSGEQEKPREQEPTEGPEALQARVEAATPAPELRTAPVETSPTPSPQRLQVPGSDSGVPDLTTQEIPPVVEELNEDEEAKVRACLREGQILQDEGQVAKAIELYQEALLEFPREGRLYCHLGYCYQQQGSHRAALLAYEDALRLGYAPPSLYNNLGVVYESLGQSQLALKAYRKAIAMGKLPDAHYNLAVLLEKRGDLEPALDQFEAYLATEPNGEFAERARARVDRLRRRVR